MAWGDTYEQLTSIANIDESAQYVLGDAEKGFHYSGTSDWGMIAQPNVQTPLYYTLKKGSDGTTFTAVTTIEEQEYYLTVPTSKTFTMSLSETSIGMATGGGIKNATSTTVWLIRVNTNLRAYSSATGSVAHFYKVVSDGVATTTTAINVPADFNTDVHTSTTAGQLTATVSANGTAISGATVTWESSNEGVATIDASGNVTLVAAGTTTITATYAGVEGQYGGSSATYTLTVTDSTPFEGGDVTFVAGTDLGTSSGQNADQITKSVVTFSCTSAALALDQYRIYKSSETTFSVPEGYYITQIVFTNADTDNPCSNLNRKNGTAGEFNQETLTWTGSSRTVVFVASAQARASQIVVTVATGTPKQTPTVEISATELEVNGDVATATVTTDGPAVTLSTSDATVASVSGTTVTAVGAGTATITATWEENDTFVGGTKEFTVTVSDNTSVVTDWVKTELADLTEDDIFVIVGNNGSNYALANDKGASAAPTAVSVTVTVNGNYLTSTVADNIKWNVSVNASDGYTFYPNGSTTTWLYCTNTNNGVRVGTNDNKVFALGNDGHVKNNATDRYLAVYPTTPDWRCYTNTTTQPTTITFYKYVGAPAPSITAEAVEIAYDDTSGSVSYTINNGVEGGTLAANTEAGWLTIVTVGETVSFTTTENPNATARTAEVELTYTYGENSVSKTVTITQTGNPNVVDEISDITETGKDYAIRGTIVAKSARGLVFGDGTGYVYYYNASGPEYNVGEKKKISGKMGSYGNVLQFTSSATFEDAETSNYNNAPAVTVVDATSMAAYSNGLHLSDYVQFEGTLVKSGNYYNIKVKELGTDASISYPTTAQTEVMDALLNKSVIVKGYFAGVSSGHFSVVLESILPEAPQLEIITVSDLATDGNKFYSTLYYSDKNLKIPAGITASGVSVNGKSLVMGPVLAKDDVIAKGNAVLLTADAAGDYEFTVVADTEVDATISWDANLLRGNDEEATTEGGDVYYQLSRNANKDANSIGFYWGAANGGTFKNKAHRAYLAVKTEQAGGAKGFAFNDMATGIKSIAADTENGNAIIYNLSGQRVNKAQKGIYIVNGKKVVIR